jgi:hypothetical protein
MFARAVVIKVKPDCKVELTRTFEQEVIPRFRKEEDFRGLFAFTVPDETEVLPLKPLRSICRSDPRTRGAE